MSSVTLFTLYNCLYRDPEYGQATETSDIVKYFCSQENYAQKGQLTEFVYETKDSIKSDFCIIEEEM